MMPRLQRRLLNPHRLAGDVVDLPADDDDHRHLRDGRGQPRQPERAERGKLQWVCIARHAAGTSQPGAVRQRRLDRRRRPSEQRQHDKEPSDIGERDVPALLEPLDDRPTFGIKVGEGHPGRRAEPDHRPAKPDRERQQAPVIPALPQGERGQWDIIEDRGQQAEPEGRLPRRVGESLQRHQRCGCHQRREENRSFRILGEGPTNRAFE